MYTNLMDPPLYFTPIEGDKTDIPVFQSLLRIERSAAPRRGRTFLMPSVQMEEVKRRVGATSSEENAPDLGNHFLTLDPMLPLGRIVDWRIIIVGYDKYFPGLH